MYSCAPTDDVVTRAVDSDDLKLSRLEVRSPPAPGTRFARALDSSLEGSGLEVPKLHGACYEVPQNSGSGRLT